MCLMKGFRTYSYNDPHPNSHSSSLKSPGYYGPLRNLPEGALHFPAPVHTVHIPTFYRPTLQF